MKEVAGGKVPRHVGVIMDGNGRWAELRGLPRVEGHREGARRAKETIRLAARAGVEALTLYTFSIENWQRPPSETSMLMKLLEYYLTHEMRELVEGNIVFRVIGDTTRLPDFILRLIERSIRETEGNTGMTVVTALSYGGRDEIVRAARRAMRSGATPGSLTEESFGSLLDTAGLPDVDLIIRTSGEVRISNFLLWQSAYAEMYFTDVLWPDFNAEEFDRALLSYASRKRRFGMVPGRETA
jgi:undecaprenyl diphosphate synthase